MAEPAASGRTRQLPEGTLGVGLEVSPAGKHETPVEMENLAEKRRDCWGCRRTPGNVGVGGRAAKPSSPFTRQFPAGSPGALCTKILFT